MQFLGSQESESQFATCLAIFSSAISVRYVLLQVMVNSPDIGELWICT